MNSSKRSWENKLSWGLFCHVYSTLIITKNAFPYLTTLMNFYPSSIIELCHISMVYPPFAQLAMILIIHHAECTHIHVFLLTLPPHVAACRLPEDTRSQILSNEFCEVKIRGEEKEKKECGEKQPTALYMSSALPAVSEKAEQVLLPFAAFFFFFFCFRSSATETDITKKNKSNFPERYSLLFQRLKPSTQFLFTTISWQGPCLTPVVSQRCVVSPSEQCVVTLPTWKVPITVKQRSNQTPCLTRETSCNAPDTLNEALRDCESKRYL